MKYLILSEDRQNYRDWFIKTSSEEAKKEAEDMKNSPHYIRVAGPIELPDDFKFVPGACPE